MIYYGDRGYYVAWGKRIKATKRASERQGRDVRAQEGLSGRARGSGGGAGGGSPSVRLWRLGRAT
jgi:hypothetical protein